MHRDPTTLRPTILTFTPLTQHDPRKHPPSPPHPAARLLDSTDMSQLQPIPWCIEWSAAIFVGVAAFSSILHFCSMPIHSALADWSYYIFLWAFFSGIAVAVLRAQNWVRVLFVGMAVLRAASFLFHPYGMYYVIRTTPAAWDHGVEVTVLVAAALCFLPATNQFFRERSRPEQVTGGD